MVDRTYTAEIFGTPEVTPLTRLDDGPAGPLYLQHLSNGPTLAFKDLAMQLLGQSVRVRAAQGGPLAQRARRHLGRHRQRGRIRDARQAQHAGLHAVAGRPDEPLPAGADVQPARPEHLQHRDRRRLRRLPGPGQGSIGGPHFKAAAGIGTVNSINWARVVAQVVYYFKGYFAATSSNDQQVSFAVPTGNFGNVLAAHIAA